MRDVLMLLLTAAFFALCLAYVWWCDRIIGPDPAELTPLRSPATQADADRSSAGAPSPASDEEVRL
jgi:hypothetical protein